MNWPAAPRGEGARTPLRVPMPPPVGMHLALEVDLFAQVDELLRPLHGLHTGIALLHQLGRPGLGHLQPPTLAPRAQSQTLAWGSEALKAAALLETCWGSKEALQSQTAPIPLNSPP